MNESFIIDMSAKKLFLKRYYTIVWRISIARIPLVFSNNIVITYKVQRYFYQTRVHIDTIEEKFLYYILTNNIQFYLVIYLIN